MERWIARHAPRVLSAWPWAKIVKSSDDRMANPKLEVNAASQLRITKTLL